MADWTITWLNLRYHWKAVLIWGIILAGVSVLTLSVAIKRAEAWVEVDTPFSSGGWWVGADEATIVINRFCADSHCLEVCNDDPKPYAECVTENDRAWRTAIRNVIQEWNDVGSNFRFHAREARGDEDVCNPRPGEVHVIVLYPGTRLCGREPAANFTSWAGLTSFDFGLADNFTSPGTARVYINANEQYRIYDPVQYAHGMLLHEFGHIVGLGHPDEHGQNVTAIMNSQVVHSSLQPDDIAGILALYGEWQEPPEEPIPEPSSTYGVFENPRHESSQSGIGVISGWVCEAGQVIILITPSDNWQDWLVETPAAYGTQRLDTEERCGDADNGFSLLFNWNLLGDGEYTVHVFVDETLILGWADVTVTTLGQEFLRGANGQYVLEGFPHPGSSVVIEWEQSLQNFVITEKRGR